MDQTSKNQHKQGFTISEVLITITIIGIVASISIPALMNYTQDLEFKLAWKKTFSAFANATEKIMNDNGGDITGITTSASDDTMRILYEPYLKILKQCPEPNVEGICWHQDNNWFFLSGGAVTSTVSGLYDPLNNGSAGNILNDGVLVKYTTVANCSSSVTYCGYILVDINGFKKPNIVGRDIFAIYLLYNKIVPLGKPTNGEGTTCTSSDNGFACSAIALYK